MPLSFANDFQARKAYGRKPPVKVVHILTEFGKTFVPVLEAITAWGNQVVLEKR
ncbi:winged helix-turn-helix transcriptional regulator [Fulvivirgaceae bacterium PWU5]|uniref:Winged helix-turn-helix transcriptional regulator n=1 Tax=Dawidia cretensis TaxID=2782350 RepID=A0AAP2E0V9_9BACT|nr:winged helix-turn-helix transcriptional regulator [Dawidia cretensis]MBT1711023.1 winged helix-turn-helix transcriptional regulator [Dawidia cretensis]